MELLLGAAIMLALLLLCAGSFYVGYTTGRKRTPDKDLTPDQQDLKRRRERFEDHFNRIFAYSPRKGG
ncbi:hypothetical protein [Paenibacillus prosopidis]|uniref:Uncharacterized protein n=1 Tax=Paenibacillus prosopidis TaxID=630520 RepID=A0A368VUD0_9BACL|nr:hypothetical protein [Paenibacillus prosopidis]RCW44226.1 hypothetical protein DFP97_11290 [Paenibacillus prosopidis]